VRFGEHAKLTNETRFEKTPNELADRGSVSVSLRKLGRALTGELILPADRRYTQLRRVRNRAVNQHPAMIARCATRQDVQLAVEFTRSQGLPIAVRSGGHSFAVTGSAKVGW
jgi:hypothetical protein